MTGEKFRCASQGGIFIEVDNLEDPKGERKLSLICFGEFNLFQKVFILADEKGIGLQCHSKKLKGVEREELPELAKLYGRRKANRQPEMLYIREKSLLIRGRDRGAA